VSSKFYDPEWRRERARIAAQARHNPQVRAERKAGALERAITDALPGLTRPQRERLVELLREGDSA
jgi:hypothetical protein